MGVKFHSNIWYLNTINMSMIHTYPHFSDSFVIKMMNQSLDFIIPFFLENEPNNEFEVFQKQSDNKTDNNRFDLLCHREGQIMS